MTTLIIEKDTLPIIKSSINSKKQLLNFDLEKCKKKLEQFEKKYKMKSSSFYKKFVSGTLGDNAHYIEWEFYYQCFRKIKKQLPKLQSIQI
jgi:hypothetical protein